MGVATGLTPVPTFYRIWNPEIRQSRDETALRVLMILLAGSATLEPVKPASSKNETARFHLGTGRFSVSGAGSDPERASLRPDPANPASAFLTRRHGGPIRSPSSRAPCSWAPPA